MDVQLAPVTDQSPEPVEPCKAASNHPLMLAELLAGFEAPSGQHCCHRLARGYSTRSVSRAITASVMTDMSVGTASEKGLAQVVCRISDLGGRELDREHELSEVQRREACARYRRAYEVFRLPREVHPARHAGIVKQNVEQNGPVGRDVNRRYAAYAQYVAGGKEEPVASACRHHTRREPGREKSDGRIRGRLLASRSSSSLQRPAQDGRHEQASGSPIQGPCGRNQRRPGVA